MSHTVPTFVRKGLLRLSWPLLLLIVFTLLATLGNTVLVSQASTDLNAAVATANQLLGVVYDISVIFSFGALVVIAQLLGARAINSARRATVLALRASIILGAVIAAAVAIASPWLLRLINTPPEIIDDALIYLWIVAGGLLFHAYIVGASAVLRAWGRTGQLLILGIVVNVLDVAMLYLFLFVLELGVVGSALPTLIVRGSGMLLLWFLVRRVAGVRVFGALPARDTDDDTGPWRMARLSIPTVLENATFNIAVVITVSWINALGTDSINARSYVFTLTALVTGVILALAQSNETIVGWDVGERSTQHAVRQTVRTAIGTAIAAAVLALLLWLGADAILSIFGPSAAVVAEARDPLLISVILLPISAVSSIIYGALRSSSDVVVPMIYSVGASLVILVPLSWLLIGVAGWGLIGAFWALVATEAVKAGLLLSRWLRAKWMQGGILG